MRALRFFSNLAIVLPAALVAACGGSDQNGFAQAPREDSSALASCLDAGMPLGVDVSQYDSTPDSGPNWPEIRDAGIVFAFARVSDGLNFPDPYFDSNWTGMKAAGIIRGSYQYFEPDQNPHTQAQMVLQHISDFGPGDLPPVIDVETLDGLDAGTAVGAVAAWVDDIQTALHRRPLIYTSVRVWTEFQFPTLDADLWVVSIVPSCPAIPATWADWTFWQYSGTGAVPGLTVEADDLDRFNGSLAELKSYALGDAGLLDAGTDAGSIDAGSGSIDAGSEDGGSIDAGEEDAGERDAGSIDAGEDAGTIDAGAIDAGADAGARDAGEAGGALPCPIDTVDAGGVCVSICGAGTVLDGGFCTVTALPSSGGCASGGSSFIACAGVLLCFSLRRKRTLRAPRKPC